MACDKLPDLQRIPHSHCPAIAYNPTQRNHYEAIVDRESNRLWLANMLELSTISSRHLYFNSNFDEKQKTYKSFELNKQHRKIMIKMKRKNERVRDG